jgi:hypothetical protein
MPTLHIRHPNEMVAVLQIVVGVQHGHATLQPHISIN